MPLFFQSQNKSRQFLNVKILLPIFSFGLFCGKLNSILLGRSLTRMTGPLVFSLLPRSIVNQGVLQESREDKDHTDPGPDVDGLGVGHGGQGVLYAGLGGGHRQQGRHPQGYPSRHLGKLNNFYISTF